MMTCMERLIARLLESTQIDAGVDTDLEHDGPKTPRPSIPPIFVVAIALWGACAIAYLSLRGADPSYLAPGAISTLVAALLLAGGLVRARRAPLVLLLLVGILLGISCASGGAWRAQSSIDSLADAQVDWTIELTGDSNPGLYGSSASARAIGVDGASYPVEVRFDDGVMLLCGARFPYTGSIDRPSERNAALLWEKGLVGQLDVASVDVEDVAELSPIERARARAIDLFAEYAGGSAGILQALVCGYRTTVDAEGAYEDYKITGLAHLVAVSGSHLAIVSSFVGFALGRLRLSAVARGVAVAIFVLSYLVFSGMPISAIRAAIMVLLGLAAQGARRRSSSLNALSLCIIAFIAVDPASSVSVSLFLSAAATLGIVLFTGLVSSWLSFLPNRLRHLVAEPLAMTIASSVTTLPFSSALFSQLPLISPVANIVVAPLFTLACVVGLITVLVSCVVPGIAPALLPVAAWCAVPLTEAVSLLAKAPFACVPVAMPVVFSLVLTVFLTFALFVAWPRLKPRVLAVITASSLALFIFAVVVLPRFHGDEIIMLDVGQGDAFLVRSEGSALLIDTGTQDGLLRSALGKHGVTRLDAVVITHGDDDHCGSLRTLRGVVAVDRVLVAEDALGCSCSSCSQLLEDAKAVVGEDRLSGLSVGDVVEVGNFDLEVIWPVAFSDEGGNADSVCLLAELDSNDEGATDWRALFCGDAEIEQIEELVSLGAVGDIDVLKVGHHGSKNALDVDLARKLSPEVALISCGAGNRYGHPHEDALSALESCNAQVLRTDLLGDVCVSFTSDALRIAPRVQ